MNIRAHYDLPNNCIVDVEIQKPKECDGHIVSILVKKGRDSLTKYLLNPTFFEELNNPKIYAETYDHFVSTEYVPAFALTIKNPAEDNDLVYLLITAKREKPYLVVKNEVKDVQY